MGILLDGKAVAASVQQAVAAEVEALHRVRGVTPTLAVVLGGEDPSSKVYEGRKGQTPRDLGIQTRDYMFPSGLSELETRTQVQELNEDKEVHGILAAMLMRNTIRACRQQIGD